MPTIERKVTVKQGTRRSTTLFAAALALAMFAISLHSASALQPDAPFLVFQQKNQAKWVEDDKNVEQKLAALRQRFGKRPNIIYVLADDVGWGELGAYLGGKVRGTPSPTLDQMANEGMKFLSHYAEPSCTPSRIAINTGRHPVRTGLNAVLWPGQTAGLSAEEVTIAEILSEAGYSTAMWGKWHLGELPEHAPENQGYDYAHYGLYNGAVYFWADVKDHYLERDIVSGSHPFHDFPGLEEYRETFGIEIKGHFIGEKGKGRREAEQITSSKAMEDFEDTSIDEITAYIKDKAKSDKPFFIYWATYFHQDASSPKEYRDDKFVDYVNNAAAQAGQHNAHMKRLLDTLKAEGIEENTLVVWVSDNGPMYYFWPSSGYSWLRGHKGQVLEGGVRTPAIAWWPGMIEPGQDPIDKIQITDLFTTAVRIAGAMDKIPSDRITDGIDQSSLLLLGEDHGRRDYIFHYSGAKIGAVRLFNHKLAGLEKGLFGAKMYNVIRDPREEHPYTGFLHLITPFQTLFASHQAFIKKFPHRKLPPTPTVPFADFFSQD
jgi:arylsulfatase